MSFNSLGLDRWTHQPFDPRRVDPCVTNMNPPKVCWFVDVSLFSQADLGGVGIFSSSSCLVSRGEENVSGRTARTWLVVILDRK